MKKHGMVLVVGIILLVLSGMVAGCGKKEADGDKLQAAIEAVAREKTPENYLTLSLRYYEVKKFDKCIEAAQESIKLKSDFAPAYNNICAAYNEQKMWDKGIEACEKGLSINPDNQLMKNNLSWARKNAGN
jgi:tetratricopeptide (TPR) repeat protein